MSSIPSKIALKSKMNISTKRTLLPEAAIIACAWELYTLPWCSSGHTTPNSSLTVTGSTRKAYGGTHQSRRFFVHMRHPPYYYPTSCHFKSFHINTSSHSISTLQVIPYQHFFTIHQYQSTDRRR
eukprot:GHVR01093701.1.p1 GENE.GHVR01093701.1~~GHVR01093701.1.p1  ORF type:complete len:125 (+),score=6.57 GHVR01093701.1:44-418(+)